MSVNVAGVADSVLSRHRKTLRTLSGEVIRRLGKRRL
jgi:hypothetical protein